MSLRTRLKEATRPAHDRLERLLHLDGAGLTRERYGEYLRYAETFHAMMEPAFDREPLTRFGLDMRARRKGPWLEYDLHALGLAPRAASRIAEEFDAVRLLGRAYVLEGSSLGGRVLLDRVQDACDVRPGAGATFLAGYAAQTGPMWKRFVAALDAIAFTAEEEARCAEAARETFEAYERLLLEGGWG